MTFSRIALISALFALAGVASAPVASAAIRGTTSFGITMDDIIKGGGTCTDAGGGYSVCKAKDGTPWMCPNNGGACAKTNPPAPKMPVYRGPLVLKKF